MLVVQEDAKVKAGETSETIITQPQLERAINRKQLSFSLWLLLSQDRETMSQ
jgi:hypothetical protein